MEIKDKKILYKIEEQNEQLKLQGEIMIASTGERLAFYGTLYNSADDSFYSQFHITFTETNELFVFLNGVQVNESEKGYSLIKGVLDSQFE